MKKLLACAVAITAAAAFAGTAVAGKTFGASKSATTEAGKEFPSPAVLDTDAQFFNTENETENNQLIAKKAKKKADAITNSQSDELKKEKAKKTEEKKEVK